jgi:hypothetical protein
MSDRFGADKKDVLQLGVRGEMLGYIRETNNTLEFSKL